MSEYKIEKNIREIFPKLNNKHFNLIKNGVIIFLKYCYGCFQMQIKITDDDIIMIIYLLLPYLKKKPLDIVSLNDIYIKKEKNVDINKTEPKYIYSNIQYDKCIESNGKYFEYEFTEDDFNQNLKLLINTLKLCSNKLHFNFINIYPLRDYTDLYNITKNKQRNHTLIDWEYIENRTQEDINNLTSGLQISDIYNVIRNDLFASIFNIKWLLYDIYNEEIGNITILHILDSIFEYNLIQYISQKNNDFDNFTEKNNFIKYWDRFYFKVQHKEKYGLIEYWQLEQILNVIKQKLNEKKNENDKKLTYENIYKLLYTDINKFKYTWYRKKYIKKNKLQQITTDKYNVFKYTYNFAKSMCYYNDKKLPEQWTMLTKEEKEVFTYRLNYHDIRWFDITRNLNIVYQNNPDYNLNYDIYNYNYNNIIENVCSVLQFKGLLTKFEYKNISLNTKQNILIKTINYFSRDIYNASNNDKNIDIYEFSSYNWINQINICHHFINNRIIYLTGSTGIGKSTEIPKLFTYFSIALNGKLAPNIICTEPRTDPTIKNANRVANTLNLPIKTEDNNYYIQYKSKTESYVNQSYNYPTITYVTDGFQLEILDDKSDKSDIVMIDESHEHNVNMDMLITLYRKILAQDKKVQLVILSATMEMDEPKYRRFFKEIKDNTNYVDRRIHIGLPNQTTRFKIDESYLRVKSNNLTKEDIIDKIKNILDIILKKKDDGHILIFQPGETDINKLVKQLNTEIQINYLIVLPFYGRMNSKGRDLIIDIDKNIHKLRFNKTEDFNTICENDAIEIGNANYTQAIIVATTIAEASITIEGLTYVIDNGLSKINKYNYKLRNSQLITYNISESSREQRKGRIGRTQPGTIYYLYQKDSLIDNSILYQMAISDLTYNVIYKYISKYDLKELMDEKGKFYFIHPEELFLKRNINGTIIGIKETDDITFKNNKIYSKKLISFFNMLKDSMYLTDDFQITNFGKEIDIIQNKLKSNKKFKDNDIIITDYHLLNMIYFGNIFNYINESYQLCVLYQLIDFNLTNLIINFKYFKYDALSDSSVLLTLLNKLNTLKYIKYNGLLSFNEYIKTNKTTINNINEYILKNFCDTYYLNYNILQQYHKQLLTLYIKLDDIKLNNKINIKYLTTLQSFNKLNCLITMSFPLNICKSISLNKYKLLYYLDPNIIVELGNTLIDNTYSDYVIYLKINITDNTINIIHLMNKSVIKLCNKFKAIIQKNES